MGALSLRIHNERKSGYFAVEVLTRISLVGPVALKRFRRVSVRFYAFR